MESSEQKPTGAIWLLIILVLIGFAAATMYFGHDNKDLTAAVQSSVNRPILTRQPRLYTVYYGLGVFSPTNIRIHVGDSIKFQNDSDSYIHITSDRSGNALELAGFESPGDISPGGVFSFTFSKAGIFGYHNSKNPSEEGTVIVRPQ